MALTTSVAIATDKHFVSIQTRFTRKMKTHAQDENMK